MKNKLFNKPFPQAEDPMDILLEALVTGGDGLIERQEKRGQIALSQSSTLPSKVNHGDWSQLEAMGVVRGEEADDLFVYVTLPEGWRIQPTEHSMWSKLLDAQGRERASIFYKAAFYDRDAFLNLTRRFSWSCSPAAGWEHARDSAWSGVVLDNGKIIWQSAEIGPEPEYRTTAYENWRIERDKLEQLAGSWLAEHYPDWENPVAYWNTKDTVE